MKYLLLIYMEPGLWEREAGEARQDERMEAYRAYTTGLVNAGVMRGGERLQPISAATTVCVRGGEQLVVDGPFAETKEWLAGYYVIEATDLDEAIQWAARCPGAITGSIEVRPIMGLPAEYREQEQPATAQAH